MVTKTAITVILIVVCAVIPTYGQQDRIQQAQANYQQEVQRAQQQLQQYQQRAQQEAQRVQQDYQKTIQQAQQRLNEEIQRAQQDAQRQREYQGVFQGGRDPFQPQPQKKGWW